MELSTREWITRLLLRPPILYLEKLYQGPLKPPEQMLMNMAGLDKTKHNLARKGMGLPRKLTHGALHKGWKRAAGACPMLGEQHPLV